MITINLLPSANPSSFYSAYTTTIHQLLATGREALNPFALIDKTQKVLEMLPPATPFASRLHGFLVRMHDLSSDHDFSPQAAQELWNQLQSRDVDMSLIPGYENLEPIGQGGFSTVYKGTETATGRTVAIKVGLLARNEKTGRRLVDCERLREIFDNEWAVLGRIQSDRVVQPIARGTTDRKKPYIVMEYAPGGTLATYMKLVQSEEFPFDLRQVLILAWGAAEAVGVLHQHGIIHKDVKLSNLLIGEDGLIKICDFSFATTVEEATRRKRNPRGYRGTPGSIPVQTSESLQDDVFGLGVGFFTLLTGRRAFNPAHPLTSLLFTPPTPSRVRPERKIPAGVDRIVMKCIHRVPISRYSNAQKVAEDLRRVLKKF